MKDPKLSGNLELTIDLSGLLDRLPPEDRINVIKRTGFVDWMFCSLCEMLATGVTKEGWWLGNGTIAAWREKLAPLMPTIQVELMRDMYQQRNEAQYQAKRHSDWAWQMYQAFVDGKPMMPALEKFEATPRASASEVAPGRADGYGVTHSYLDLSNHHLTRSTYEWLEGEADANPRRRLMTTVAPYEYGIFVGVPADLDAVQALDGPEDLKAVLAFARGLGCNVVRFDRDADAVALPSYDWEAAEKVAA